MKSFLKRLSIKLDSFLDLRRSLFFILSILIFIQSCSNSMQMNWGLSGTQIQAPPPSIGSSSGGASTFTLNRVVKDNLNPSTVFDLIGDGSGSFGSLCQSSSSSTSSCECNYKYSSSTHPNQQVFTPVTYTEDNLIRCSYDKIPSDVTRITISIHLITVDTYSNTVTLSLGSAGTTLDVTNPNSFIQPVRYQCRDVVSIPYIFDSTIYDPFQSEDPHLSYPIDFYASNLANAMTQYVGVSTNDSWNCPPTLNPQKFLTPDYLNQFNSTQQMNYNIYSKTALPGGGKQIYPPNGTIDRSTFYLAKQAAGAFSVAVNANLAPSIITAEGGNGTPAPLGYGAQPIAIGVGTGQETCDTSISIPAGFHWMKLWLFRAGLAQRHYAKSGNPGPSIADIQSVSCNPGAWSADATPHNPVFPQCDRTIPNGGNSLSMQELSTNHPLADRVLGNNQCMRFDDNPKSTIAAVFCGPHPGAGCSSSGEDSWLTEPPLSAISSQVGCSANPLNDPMGMCIDQTTAKTPITYSVGTGDLDASSPGDSNAASARFDFLFVVSPPSINTVDMQDTSSSSRSLPYQPYRFLTYEDCQSSDPDSDPTCNLSNAITNFGLKLHDVGTNGDPPANDPNRAGVFPVCVLQPDAS